MSINIENFMKLVSNEESGWLKDSKYRKENRYWIRTSQKIALIILEKLDELNIDKFDLSKQTNIPFCKIEKMIKGSYNFTLEEIRKIEISLNIEIIKINL